MLRTIKQIQGDKLGATDGEIGRVKDFYFDDSLARPLYYGLPADHKKKTRLVSHSPCPVLILPGCKDVTIKTASGKKG